MNNLYHDIYQLIPLLEQADYNATFVFHLLQKNCSIQNSSIKM